MRTLHRGPLIVLPQDSLDTGSPGNPHVSGAGQAGSTLVLAGFSSGYAIPAGRPFSLIQGGRR
ncbi:hypothetical protein KOF26_07495 [Sphingomonas sp. XMGL2]|uniref:Uncharacterized protein n=1 Tax=Sphingomonas quercus TaxID=2842451 RepID=A0ABS6BKC5_9SPHN|nr:hypothetical protein [Sphingomonas quercus]